MLTKDVTQELENILTLLQQQGKEPSVALVKSRLSTSVPMPALIATIKSWKNAHRVPKVEVSFSTENSANKIAELETQLAALSARVAALEAQLTEK
ncbi:MULTISPECIES: hypothetical protein [Vibrio]|uniref:hypothetical protein n=1 Tax=Vibrio TaxID=662 RepID=UPI00097E35F7|nr:MULTISPECIES: hypothetical protein [Vibrio]ASF99324.1 hypothetical protein CEG15_03865 [Vibrio anguillarum]MBT2949213.1 hypothetical protein [Vibrio anguillarum]MDQ2165404.1 hypothetical protein [Vibrio anguillarum]NNN96808.1 hypothetical protein [Vibrio sp. B4-6]